MTHAYTNMIEDTSIAGFPILIKNPKYRILHGKEVLDIDHNEVFSRIFLALLFKPGAFTGRELRFIRNYLEMTQTQFSIKFLSNEDHARISTWERKKHETTGMEPTIETAIRMDMANQFQELNKKAYKAFLDQMIKDGVLKQKNQLWPLLKDLPTQKPQQIAIDLAVA